MDLWFTSARQQLELLHGVLLHHDTLYSAARGTIMRQFSRGVTVAKLVSLACSGPAAETGRAMLQEVMAELLRITSQPSMDKAAVELLMALQVEVLSTVSTGQLQVLQGFAAKYAEEVLRRAATAEVAAVPLVTTVMPSLCSLLCSIFVPDPTLFFWRDSSSSAPYRPRDGACWRLTGLPEQPVSQLAARMPLRGAALCSSRQCVFTL